LFDYSQKSKKREYALKEYIHLDFFDGRYGICVRQDLRWRHFEVPFGRYWVVDDPVEGMLRIDAAVAC
jgi:hypothetical protein